ncbi:SCO family protein [Consotaella salsifontis]|uniref:Protein SCO1/2 n=1 Tax=Consotaella salsifontis TaxID=1365950 RepID=A0A1T4M8J2_9HYPH|nr:SCO family protein [Consotaella salsifontis]SJZ63343.1 protein SCO1/2 [Consotaella salsifontis]
MKARSFIRIGLWAAVAVMAGAILWTVLFYSNASPLSEEKPYGVPFALVDQDGQPVTEAVFQGRPTAVFFGYTHCPDVCPTSLYEMAGYQESLKAEGHDLQVVFVSVDPTRDTSEILKNYLSALDANIVGITGDPQKVAAMAKGWGIYSEKVPGDEPDEYTMNHTATIFLLDGKGRLKSTIAFGEDPKSAAEKLENLFS